MLVFGENAVLKMAGRGFGRYIKYTIFFPGEVSGSRFEILGFRGLEIGWNFGLERLEAVPGPGDAIFNQTHQKLSKIN